MRCMIAADCRRSASIWPGVDAMFLRPLGANEGKKKKKKKKKRRRRIRNEKGNEVGRRPGKESKSPTGWLEQLVSTIMRGAGP